MAEESVFLEFFGNSPQFRIIDFLLENRLKDFTKTEIAKGAGISWASLFNHWEELEKNNIVKPTRGIGKIILYQLDEGAPMVKQLRKMELLLIKNAAEEEEVKMVSSARAGKRK
ncbi:hypothetical protein COU37_04020 [Candidatus Micrarchaeota archaeon CG10_big_fil_rev_8_21_14_0_10_45_29]|nr:MAG: hypothetical protein COU37_04020 [Candidatus Micrarchaeota archaeon CG10_big_fil_rev_8_21_14_0_10_45_29]